jgi:hypothetical protein
MKVETFLETAEEGLTGDCFRLSCKHAFHAACIISSLRASGSTCPICRDGEEAPTTFQFQFVEEVEEEEPNRENNEILTAQQSRDVRVQASASNLNRSVKSFNIFRDELRASRRKTLAVAMREFRNKHQRGYKKQRERVRQALASYSATVNAALPEPIELVDLNDILSQDNSHASVRKQDPTKLGFWYY